MRADLTDPDCPDWRKYLFPCDCHDHHWLLFEWWDDDPDEDYPGTLDVVPTTWAPRLRQRIATAVQVLFGRRAWTTDCVLLDEDTATRLRATIDEYLANEATKRARRAEAEPVRSSRAAMARVLADRLGSVDPEDLDSALAAGTAPKAPKGDTEQEQSR